MPTVAKAANSKKSDVSTNISATRNQKPSVNSTPFTFIAPMGAKRNESKSMHRVPADTAIMMRAERIPFSFLCLLRYLYIERTPETIAKTVVTSNNSIAKEMSTPVSNGAL